MVRQRKSLKRPPKNQIFIFSDGDTECNYFDQIKKDLTGNNRRISVKLSRTNKKSAVESVKYARSYLLSRNKFLNENDRAFCVFDMDTASDEDIEKAIKIMPSYMQLIVSNPDFELWFLLHYEYRREALGNREPITKLREYEPDYQKPHVERIYSSLKDKEAVALKNAQLLRQHQREEGHDLYSKAANPYTDVDKVISYIYAHCTT